MYSNKFYVPLGLCKRLILFRSLIHHIFKIYFFKMNHTGKDQFKTSALY